MKYLKWALIVLFSALYISVGFVSVYHAINFFSISNENWLAIILALAFEIGQATVLFSLLTSKSKKIMPWVLMITLTIVQVLGNIYSSYQYMMLYSTDKIKYFTESVLFFLQDPNPQVNQVMISYITGAILPIVALCMTSMIVDAIGIKSQDIKSQDIKSQDIKSSNGENNPEEKHIKTNNDEDVKSDIDKFSKIVY